jgi:hypothetical protein
VLDSILFVTSFSDDMYEVSGRHLLASYADVRQGGSVVAFYEGRKPPQVGTEHLEDLSADPFLLDWLKANEDIIPVHLGGKYPWCSCPGNEKRHAKHLPGCRNAWMNRNASRWFRKVAALRLTVKYSGCRYLVWLDSDSVFKQAVPVSYLATKLDGVAMFYFRGHRPAVESGILGFDLGNGGATAIADVCDLYASGKFREFERWDDGFVWAKLLDSKHKWQASDLVHPTKYKGRTNDVIPTTDIAEYLEHRKGLHGTQLNIMK